MKAFDPVKPIAVNPVEEAPKPPSKIERVVIYILVLVLGGSIFFLLNIWFGG